jgi:hypothetical protein
MARHICSNCGATVIDEEFCPSCGSWIDTIADSKKAPEEYEQFELGEAPSDGGGKLTAVQQEIICPSCGAPNSAGNRHCEECGARLMQGPLPTAPRPAVQATAGVRAVIAIAALLLGIILIALLFNVFRGQDIPTTTTPSTTNVTDTVVAPQVGPLTILRAECAPEGLGGDFGCINLVNDRMGEEFQINWNELPANEKQVVITLIFEEPVTVRRIDWVNLSDATRFRQNYRVQSVSLKADDSQVPLPIGLEDKEGTQTLTFVALRTNTLVFTVLSVYQAQVVEEKIWDELAIDEIVVLGYPYLTIGQTTTTAATTTTP